MRIAFYAPLKAPDHPVPSGDRRLGAAFVAALAHAGHTVELASHFRSFDARGDASRQARLAHCGEALAARLVGRYRRGPRPEAWFTYHVYHKAPDWLGPAVSRALAIPYVVAEASTAAKQRDGPWARGYAQALHAIRAADAVVAVNPADVGAVARARQEAAATGPIVLVAPFLDLAGYGAAPDALRVPAPGPARLVTVAMMRAGAKLASYRVLAEALAGLDPAAWSLDVIGDGPQRGRVEALFAGFDRNRVRFLGEQGTAEIAAHLGRCDVFVWPAIDEAFGMVFIEAQASGLPVVGGDGAGVASVVAHGRSGLLVPCGDAPAFAAAIARLIADPLLRQDMGRAARAYVHARHDLRSAARTLAALLERLRGERPVSVADPAAARSW